MSTENDIEAKAELAVVRHLAGISTAIGPIDIHPGIQTTEIIKPSIIVAAQGAEETIYGTGQYAVDLEIELRTSMDDTTDTAHRAKMGAIRDEFANSWVGASLSAGVSQFTACGVVKGTSKMTVEDRDFVSVFPLKVHCRPSA
jgi:hypothetical protein